MNSQNNIQNPTITTTTANVPEISAIGEDLDPISESNRGTCRGEMVDSSVTGTSAPNIATALSPQLRSLSLNESQFDLGYDSDGEIGPFDDAVEIEGPQIFEEKGLEEMPQLPVAEVLQDVPMIGEDGVAMNTNNPSPAPVQTFQPHFINLTDEEISQMTKSNLMEELKIRDVKFKSSDKKEIIKAKLIQAIKEKKMVVKMRKIEIPKAKSSVGKDFPISAYWRKLEPDDVPIAEPANPTFNLPRAPTIEQTEAKYVPVKFNFSKHIFTVPPFTGEKKQIKLQRDRPVLKNGKKVFENVSFEKGYVKETYKTTINPLATPSEIVDVFFPFRKNVQRVNGASQEMLSIELITKWTNLKASVIGAGSTTYKDFKPFTAEEIRRHMGLYILQGVQPSPSIEMKFKSSAEDPCCGNNMCYKAFGSNAVRRHRQFKAFFSLQDPRKFTPLRKDFPNWKIRPLLQWMNYISPKVYQPGKSVSVDEMTIGFKGKHKDKKRITYKAEGDGFQADALCDDGYTLQVFPRNDPAPREYLKQGLSPLHSRVMKLFDVLHFKHHQCGMDNLFNSAAFCRAAFNHPKSVLTHGVTRKSGRGIPKCVIQEEVKNNKDAERSARGTVLAAVLEGDKGCPNLIAASVYDTKPVHYLSMITEQIQWVQKETKVFNCDTDKMEMMKFLRMGFIDIYNQTMGDVDLADQLRGNYRPDRWIRNRKWWWAMSFWGWGVLLTNAYVSYCKVCDEEGVPKKDRLTHLQFRKEVAVNWIDPEFYSKSVSTLSNKKRKRDCNDTVFSPITLDSALELENELMPKSKKRCTAVKNASLDPHKGDLSMRLNPTYDHMPEPKTTKKKARCALHTWLGYEYCSQVMHCLGCNVNLCIFCFKKFHSEPDIVSKRDHLKKTLNPEKLKSK